MISDMRNMILICLFFFLFSFPAFAGDKWDKWDEGLIVSLVASRTIDCLQTIKIIETANNYEKYNPLIREGAEHFGTSFIPFYFISTSILTYKIADILPSVYRKAGLSIFLGTSVFMIKHNHSIGVGLSLPF